MSKKFRYRVTLHSGESYDIDANSSLQAKTIVIRNLIGERFGQIKDGRKAIKHCRIIAKTKDEVAA